MNTSKGEISPNDVVAFSALRSQRGKDNALSSKSSTSGGSGGITELAAQAIFHLLDQREARGLHKSVFLSKDVIHMAQMPCIKMHTSFKSSWKTFLKLYLQKRLRTVVLQFVL